MIKPETQAAIKAMPLENRQNLLRFIYTTMNADDFADSFLNAEGDKTDEYAAISVAFAGEPDEDEAGTLDEIILDEDDATRLHEAICEGRRQDAVDLLNEITALNFRTVSAQMNLFPNRVSL